MGISLISKLREVPLVFLDVETTGASADFGDRIIEIGIVRFDNGVRTADYERLLNPRRRISAGVVALTGISQEMVDSQLTFQEILPDVSELLCGAVIIGHNIRFDLSFLTREFRCCRDDILQRLGPAQVLDTVRIARRRFGRGGNGLQRLAPRLGFNPSIAHRALADAQTAAEVFERLMAPVGGWDMCLCDAIAQQGGPMGLAPASPRESLLPLQLQEALDHRVPVKMEYLDADECRTERVVDPIEIRRRRGELILIAHCHMRNDRRTFKLERIVQISAMETAAPEQPMLFDVSGNPDASPMPDVAAAMETIIP